MLSTVVGPSPRNRRRARGPARGWLFAATALLLTPSTNAEVWETTRGERLTAKLSGVYGPLVVLAQGDASSTLSVGELTDEGLGRVADFLRSQPTSPPAWNASASTVAKALKNRLQLLRQGQLVDFEPGPRPEPDFYLIYFGANWCPPCQAFSPKLVTAYERLKQLAPEKFEVVFVSSDRDPSEQLKYIEHVNMPWPVLRFSHRGRAPAIERWAGTGIPCLVVITREGEALLHSYRGQEYVGPYDVLQRFESLLRAGDPKAAGTKRVLHRLAVAQHVRAAAGGNRSVAPYLLGLDPRRYQTLEVKALEATVAVDERGRVTEATFKPELPAVLQYQMNEDAATWLFLPAIENGVPRPRTVVLPLTFGK